MTEYIIRPPEKVGSSLDLQPIIVGEIVRCRDCMYYRPDPYLIDPGWSMYCEDTGRDMIDPDGFCAWAERKGDAE